ncbi:hypothetical protein ZWY2020_034029 [Hordeum vulgare]|nr:hypothetical protein ZWY2020_034029 [Hordeum vulgare]
MASSAGGNSSGAGGDPPSIRPTSLDAPATEELHRFCMLVRRCGSCEAVKVEGRPRDAGPRRRRSVVTIAAADTISTTGTRFGTASPTPTSSTSTSARRRPRAIPSTPGVGR